ncbi:MAG: zf-TFIIB domain-containing protein [Mangrovicoccus sp.]|nr:zf-TFIIB domain-containing protein [Mangrovicoccus sp.]
MKCPLDGTPLATTERCGVEIDYCPNCRGVWLDRDELERIIERSILETAPVKARIEPTQPAYAAGRGSTLTREITRRRHRDAFLDDLFDF